MIIHLEGNSLESFIQILKGKVSFILMIKHVVNKLLRILSSEPKWFFFDNRNEIRNSQVLFKEEEILIKDFNVQLVL